ncbi:MAG TPA: ABC transporter permease [Gemmatimonadales bacterium]|nr:ABC transporter permease [Gemmatimonadales bacterium]
MALPAVRGAAWGPLLVRAARRLRRAPAVALAAILTIAIGVGVTTAVFSLVDGVLLRPLGFPHAERLVALTHTLVVHGGLTVPQSDATYLYYRQANHVFTNVGAYRTLSVNLGTLGATSERAERVEGTRASAGLFDVLGVPPQIGRPFRDAEDLPNSPPVVLLSDWLWRTRFGGSPSAIGQVTPVDGVPHLIIGVMPAQFAFPDASTAVWLPIGIDPTKTATAAFIFSAVARLRPGVTAGAALSDLRALLPQVPVAFPGRLTVEATSATHMAPVVRPLRDALIGDVGRALWIALGSAGFVLLVACANVTNLFLVRGEARRHDLQVRRALGAERGAIVADFLAEGLLIAGLGGAAGVVLAGLALRVLGSLGDGLAIPRLGEVGLHPQVLLVVAGLILFTAVVTSAVPALRSADGSLGDALRQAGRATTGTSRKHHVLRAFGVVQIALALVLVTGAGLMVRSFQRLRSVPLGFEPIGVYSFRLDLPMQSYPTASSSVTLVNQGLSELAALPGAVAAGAASTLPLEVEGHEDTAVFIPGRPLGPGVIPVIHPIVLATPGYFAALRIRFLDGHGFDEPDPRQAPLQVVIGRSVARRYWGDSVAVGRQLQFAPNGPRFTVVGVTVDTRDTRLDAPPDETLYLPFVIAPGPAAADSGASTARWAPRNVAFVVRTAGPVERVKGAVQRMVSALAPGVPVYDDRAMTSVINQSTARTSFILWLLEVASMAALAIGAVGLYGITSYLVSLRTRELALRGALGAQPATLLALVMGQSLRVAAMGIVLGLVGVLLLTRFLAALLYDIRPTDPIALTAAVLLLGGVALAASWIPARRASRTDPATALQADL